MPSIYCPQDENNPEIMTERNLFTPLYRSHKTVHFLINNFSHLSLEYIEHSPISINGNAEFNATAASEGWLGNGTSSNPYVIDGLNITGPSTSPLIDIHHDMIRGKVVFTSNLVACLA